MRPYLQPYAANDGGGFRDVLPPGTNGVDDAAELANFLAHRPAPARTTTTSSPMYRDLLVRHAAA